MAINVSVGEPKVPTKNFPKLMRNTNTDSVAFFSSEYSAIMLRTTAKSTVGAGVAMTSVVPSHWVDYNEPLTIQNV